MSSYRQRQLRAVRDMALIVDIVSHTPDTGKRDVSWWRQVRERLCAHHEVRDLSVRPMPKKSKKPTILPLKDALALQMAAEGYTTEQAAEALTVSTNTIKTHRKRVMQALGARNIAHAVALGISIGAIEGIKKDEKDSPVSGLGSGSVIDGAGLLRDSVREGSDLSRDLV